MRTYSRKRIEQTELENVMDLCRLCLEKLDEFVPIYTESSKLSPSLALRILVCVGVEISYDELLPNKICSQCHTEIQRYYEFRKKCAKSYQRLNAHVQAVKAKERKEQNLMFTINSDGSILLKDGHGHNSLFADDEPLVRLTKILDDEAKATNSEVLHRFDQCGVKPVKFSLQEHTIDTSQLPDKVKDQEPNEILNQPCEILPLVKEKIVPEAETATDPEISEFLSTMLTDLEFLTRHGDGTIDLGPKTSRTLELETKDGKNITFELVEEGDEMEQEAMECQSDNICIISEEVKAVSSPKGSNWRAIAKCAECGKLFANRGVLARHDRNVHKRLTPHVCHYCGKKFAQKEVMGRHLLVHRDKRPFQCDKCPKSFTQRSSLVTHSRLHQPPQDRSLMLHQCNKCSKVFLYASGLTRHLFSHTNKQVACGECGRKFVDKSSLRRHEKTLGHQVTNQPKPKINAVCTEKLSVSEKDEHTEESVPQTDIVYKECKPVVPPVLSSDTGG